MSRFNLFTCIGPGKRVPLPEVEVDLTPLIRKAYAMASITPTIGRVVLYWPDKEFRGCRPDAGQPLPALIARVWSDTSINVGGFDANGMPFNATSVHLVPADSEPLNLSAHYATWMPYQKGQAAKTEALEKQVAGA